MMEPAGPKWQHNMAYG